MNLQNNERAHRASFGGYTCGLFRNATCTGATVSHFLLNGVAGMLLVSMMLVPVGGAAIVSIMITVPEVRGSEVKSA
jgi:hypothetical protein